MTNTTFPHIVPLITLLERDAAVLDSSEPWENLDNGVEIVLAHLEAARMVAHHGGLYHTNAEVKLQGKELADLMWDLGHTAVTKEHQPVGCSMLSFQLGVVRQPQRAPPGNAKHVSGAPWSTLYPVLAGVGPMETHSRESSCPPFPTEQCHRQNWSLPGGRRGTAGC